MTFLPTALSIVGAGARNLSAHVASRKGFFIGSGLRIPLIGLSSASFANWTQRQLGTNQANSGGAAYSVARATFQQLRMLTRSLGEERVLSITGFDITNGTLAYFNADMTPDMPISTAVRASSSIPIIFAPVEWDGHLYVDGAVLRRIPVDAFQPKGMLALQLGWFPAIALRTLLILVFAPMPHVSWAPL